MCFRPLHCGRRNGRPSRYRPFLLDLYVRKPGIGESSFDEEMVSVRKLFPIFLFCRLCRSTIRGILQGEKNGTLKIERTPSMFGNVWRRPASRDPWNIRVRRIICGRHKNSGSRQDEEHFPPFLRKVLIMQIAKLVSAVLVGMVLLGWAGTAQAQCACESSVVAAPSPAPTVSYLPVVAGPVVPVAPAPVVVYRPVVAAPVLTPVVNPVVVYRPVLPVVSPAPTVVYRPVGAAEVLAPAPVVVGPPAVIRTKVYYPGEPVRNLLKAITP